MGSARELLRGDERDRRRPGVGPSSHVATFLDDRELVFKALYGGWRTAPTMSISRHQVCRLKDLLQLPPSLRTAIYKQQCAHHIKGCGSARLASTARTSPSKARSSQTKRPQIASRPTNTPRTTPSTTPGPRAPIQPTAYAAVADKLVEGGQPVLLYSAPPHQKFYLASAIISSCFLVGGGACVNSIAAGYHATTLTWQLPALGLAAGLTFVFAFRSAVATRKLVKEMWLLPRGRGMEVGAPRMVEIVCRPWPLPVGRTRSRTVPLADVTLSKQYGSMLYDESARISGHSVASDAAARSASRGRWRAPASQSDRDDVPPFVGSFVKFGDWVRSVAREGKQVLNWTGLNAYVIVKDVGPFRLDGRGVMLQGGKGTLSSIASVSAGVDGARRVGCLVQAVLSSEAHLDPTSSPISKRSVKTPFSGPRTSDSKAIVSWARSKEDPIDPRLSYHAVKTDICRVCDAVLHAA